MTNVGRALPAMAKPSRRPTGAAMLRSELIGMWQLVHFFEPVKDGMKLTLREDGTAIFEGQSPSGERWRDSTSTWEYVNPRKWRLKRYIEPDPDTPGLEEGVVEIIDYDVQSFDRNRMELMEFDYEAPFTYERVE